jgi:hypothetical protein
MLLLQEDLMIRCFYIANAATGDYFVLEQDINAFIQRVVSYAVHLRNSPKVPNTYMMGSVEMSQFAYDKQKERAIAHQEERIKADTQREAEKKEEPSKELIEDGSNVLSFPSRKKDNDQDPDPKEPA